MSNIKDTLQQRQETHGKFENVAYRAITIKRLLPIVHRERLPVTAIEGFDMIASKLARICSGDPMEPDHWHDIAGYATLVEQYIRTHQEPSKGADK